MSVSWHSIGVTPANSGNPDAPDRIVSRVYAIGASTEAVVDSANNDLPEPAPVPEPASLALLAAGLAAAGASRRGLTPPTPTAASDRGHPVEQAQQDARA